MEAKLKHERGWPSALLEGLWPGQGGAGQCWGQGPEPGRAASPGPSQLVIPVLAAWGKEQGQTCLVPASRHVTRVCVCLHMCVCVRVCMCACVLQVCICACAFVHTSVHVACVYLWRVLCVQSVCVTRMCVACVLCVCRVRVRAWHTRYACLMCVCVMRVYFWQVCCVCV